MFPLPLPPPQLALCILILKRPVVISPRLPNILLFELFYSVNLRLHQPKVAISRIFGHDNHSKISLASLQNIPLFDKISCYLSSASRTMRERWSFQVSRSSLKLMKICNFRIISQIRNSGLFGNLELMKIDLILFTAHKDMKIKHLLN